MMLGAEREVRDVARARSSSRMTLFLSFNKRDSTFYSKLRLNNTHTVLYFSFKMTDK